MNCNCSYHRRNPLAWLDAERKPITIVGGFLGSGKTTLVNHLLASASEDEHIAVLVREFGDISIDDQIIKAANSQVHTYFGYTMHDDPLLLFYDYLLRIYEESYSPSGAKRFDRLIMENSGAEDPERMLLLLFDEDMRDAYSLGSYIGIVDAQYGMLNFSQFKTARKQIAMADIILLNKTDLAQPQDISELESCIKKLNPIAKIIPCSYASVDPDKLFDVDWYEQMSPITFGGETQMDEIKTVTVVEKRPMDKEKVNRWITELFSRYGEDLLRSKGFFCFAGEDYRYEFQGVRANFNSKADKLWSEEDDRRSVVVLIGEQLPEYCELQRSFSECAAE